MREITLEIYEGENCIRHKLGETFKWPEEAGKVCPWLLASADAMIKVLQYDGTLRWKYEGTPYEKIIDKDEITTEYVRCPDPTEAGVVMKITAKKVNWPPK
jgi:uncharacterized repeat protein (TIGR04076 family)